MKLSKKDIDVIISVTKDGEIAPIRYKNGKLLVPTNNGIKTRKTKKGGD